MSTEKHETYAEITAELRSLSKSEGLSIGAQYHKDYPTVCGKPICVYFADLADRIEAVAKRVDVSKTETTTVGNAAATREALVKIRRELNFYCNGCTLPDRMTEDPPDYTCLRDSLLEIERIVAAALSAPPRQCDVGTPEQQRARHDEYCLLTVCCTYSCRECFARWGQTPYAEEGAGK